MRRRACLLRTLRPRTLRSSFAISLVTGLLGWLAPPLCAQNLPAPPTVFPHPDDEPVTISGQVNVISQWHPDFRALYSGDNSLRNREERATSRVLTISTRVRLSRTTEVGVDVESAGGSGLSEALGVAGFTNLDVVRNPTLGSNPYLARLIVHHTRGPLDVTVGKLSTVDFFDRNSVGSDSHLQFMNWSVANNGAYDYAADTRGYTFGAVAQYRRPSFTLRAGEMLMPTVANGITLDWRLSRARAENVELELRRGRSLTPTTIRLLGFLNHANMGDYRLAAPPHPTAPASRPVIESTREQGRLKYGVGINLEHQFAASARGYARWGVNEPHYESFAYTEVNDSVAVGADSRGERWRRKYDRLGIALVSNGISADHQRYLAQGGLGFLLGDGALTYGREQIVESYYTAHVWRGVSGALDLQRIAHPGYNRDRGPVSVLSVRLHLDL